MSATFNNGFFSISWRFDIFIQFLWVNWIQINFRNLVHIFLRWFFLSIWRIALFPCGSTFPLSFLASIVTVALRCFLCLVSFFIILWTFFRFNFHFLIIFFCFFFYFLNLFRFSLLWFFFNYLWSNWIAFSINLTRILQSFFCFSFVLHSFSFIVSHDKKCKYFSLLKFSNKIYNKKHNLILNKYKIKKAD